MDQTIVEETAQSPAGHWYPTLTRRKGAVEIDGKKHDQLTFYYVDFKSEIPDKMFEVPKVGMVFDCNSKE